MLTLLLYFVLASASITTGYRIPLLQGRASGLPPVMPSMRLHQSFLPSGIVLEGATATLGSLGMFKQALAINGMGSALLGLSKQKSLTKAGLLHSTG